MLNMVDNLQVQGWPGKGLLGVCASSRCGARQGGNHQLASAMRSYEGTMVLIFMHYYAMNSGAAQHNDIEADSSARALKGFQTAAESCTQRFAYRHAAGV